MDYASLVTSQHNQRPNFMAVLEALTRPLADCVQVTADLPEHFNIDTAIGAQLDIIGRWVGLSRLLMVPLDENFFSWNVVGKGWNEANWKGPFTSSVGISSMGDDLYRLALKTKIAKNYWQGTNEEMQEILAASLASEGLYLVPVDGMDMSLTVHIQGTPTAQVRELIERGYITPKPMGVRINNSDDGGTGLLWFALDSATSGLDQGIFS